MFFTKLIFFLIVAFFFFFFFFFFFCDLSMFFYFLHHHWNLETYGPLGIKSGISTWGGWGCTIRYDRNFSCYLSIYLSSKAA